MNIRFSQQIRDSLSSPFSHQQKLDWWLVAVFIMINSLAFYNVLIHDPRIGYDAEEHLKYMDTLSRGKLPSNVDTKEFFSPPLPYMIGGLAQAVADISTYNAARVSQVVNGFLSMGLLFLLLKTCLLINPRPSLRLGTLTAIGLLPVYYKSLVFVRGEPYLAFLGVLVLFQMVKILYHKDWKLTQMIILGAALGLGALSRQWGFFFFPAVGIVAALEWFGYPPMRRVIAQGVLATFLTAGVITAWFYASLYVRYGSVTAFNRSPADRFSFSNQPLSFYLGLSPRLLFSQPVRPNFTNQFWPILYSETWGDYWGYFSIYGKDTRNSSYISGIKLLDHVTESMQESWFETNYHTFSTYLGRANLVALFPSLLAGCGVLFTLYRLFQQTSIDLNSEKKVLAFLLLAVITTVAGYGWFLIQYPSYRGDTLKATYLLQIFPYLAVLVGNLLSWIECKSRRLYILLLAGLVVVIIHNLPAMVSHYVSFSFVR